MTHRPSIAHAALGPEFFDVVAAAEFPAATLRHRNQAWAARVGLDGLSEGEWIAHLGRFVPLPESAARLAAELSVPDLFGAGGLTDVLLKKARDETSLDIKRTDFKLDMLSAHFFMNFRVVDEHGRQLGQGRNLGALKAELGSKARGAFQALAGLKLASSAEKLGSGSDFAAEKLGSEPV